MQRDKNEGSITVFLAVNFLVIMAMLGTLIDGARLVEAHAQLYYAADLAATSALGSFNYQLKDRYGLFAYEDNPDALLQQIVEQNLSSLKQEDLSSSDELYQYIYGTVLNALGTQDISKNKPFDLLQLQEVKGTPSGIPITLGNKNEFERQIFEYVKFRGPIELLTADLTFDFSEMTQELEKAENEDDADSAMQALEDLLADHIENQGIYNDNMTAFKVGMKSIEENRYQPLSNRLDDSPSLQGLGGLKQPMDSLSDVLRIEEVCDARIAEINRLIEGRDATIEACEQMKKRFSGGGEQATFDGKAISGEALAGYLKQIDEIAAGAALYWDGASETSLEQQKYATIKDLVSQIRSDISDFQDEIDELEEEADEYEESDEAEEALSGLVEDLWERMESYFSRESLPFFGGSMGIFVNSEQLQRLLPYYAKPDSKDESKTWSEKAKETSEQEEKRNYTRSIPEEYPLPSAMDPGEIDNALVLELDTNFPEGLSLADAREKREKNQQETQGVKNLFQGLGDLTLNTLDNAMLGVYALGNFQNALCFDTKRPADYGHSQQDLSHYSLNMRNDPIEDHSIFFEDCEVEYLIKGNLSEQANYQGIRNELSGIYFILNYAGIRRTVAIKASVEATARVVQAAVTGATLGLGAGAGVVAYYATREASFAALAAIQTSHDLQRLYLGNKVPLLKRSDADYCGLGLSKLFSEIGCSDHYKSSQIPIGYTDYLFIRMVFTGQDNLRGRMQNLIELNMNVSGGTLKSEPSFRLTNARTSVMVRAEATMPFFFINVIMLSKDYGQTGMKITKYSSQQY